MKLVEATVKYPPGKIFPSKLGTGSRQNVVVALPSGEESTIWFAAGHAAYTELRRGDRCQFVRDSKGKLQLLDADEYAPVPQPQSQPQSAGISAEKKREIAEYIEQQARLYAFCFAKAQQELKLHEPTEETIRAAASSLYIATQRKFSL